MCSSTSKGSKDKSKKKPVGTFDAYDRTEEKSTPMNLTPTSKVKAFGENSHADTLPKKMCEAHSMMREKHMSDLYWAEAASTAVYLMNRCTTDGVHELTPYEILVGRKPILSHLKVFGSIANIRIPNEYTHPEVEVHPDDSNLDDSALSLDSEFGVPIMRTPRVKKALKTTNEKLRRSSQAKTQVTRYMALQ